MVEVTAIKIDPYINLDAGTMNPLEHGEIFVTEDEMECDQDIGHYERFLNKNIYRENYFTTGQVYETVIHKERGLKYKGKCVEVVPHVPQEIIRRIKKVASKTKADFVLIEIGGTVGEYQNLLFLEAGRMMKLKEPDKVIFILVSYLPIPQMVGEMKTKPTQHAVRILNEAGIHQDIIIARSTYPLDKPRKEKISIFCNIKQEDIISAPDIKSIYEIPLNFEKENLGRRILKKFNLRAKKKNLHQWTQLVKTIKTAKEKIKIGIAGKYFRIGKFTLMDSYISVIEAIKHASYFFKRQPEIIWLDVEKYENKPTLIKELKEFNGIIIPGGFGFRGIEGKIKVIKFCRENKIPFLGLCLGMQLAVIEFARNVCNLKEVDSKEFNPKAKHLIIDLMEEQKKSIKKGNYGGTMRLGAYTCQIKRESLSYKIYKNSDFEKKINGDLLIFERHRHRYELNNKFKEILEKKGMIIAGINPETNLVEIIEIKNHPFFIATQFHPEFKSRPLNPHPLFRELIRKSVGSV